MSHSAPFTDAREGGPPPRRSDLFAAMLPALGLTLVALWTGMRWDTNDDPAMRAIADGSLSGRPSYRLAFSDEILGFVLQRFYLLTDAVPWYGLHLWLGLIAATTALCWLVLQAVGNSRRGKAVAATLAALTLLIPYLHYQFTVVSILCCGTGWLLFVARPVFLISLPRSVGWAAGALLSYGYLIRPQGLVLTGVLLSPPVVLALFRSHPQMVRRVFGSLLVVVALALAVDSAVATADDGWSEYKEFNETRGTLSVTTRDLNRADTELSETDIARFEQWAIWDSVTFSQSNLDELSEATAPPAIGNPIVGIRDAFEAIRSTPSGASLLVLLAGSVVALRLLRDKKVRIALVASVGLLAIGLGRLASTSRLPARVFIPSLALFIWMLVLAVLAAGVRRADPVEPEPLPPTTHRYSTIVAFALVLLVVPAQISGLVGEHARSGDDAAAAAATLQVLGAADRPVLYVDTIPSEFLNPWDARSHLPDNALPLGWLTRSPEWEIRRSALGIDDLDLALRDGDVLLIDDNHLELSRVLEQHFSQRWPGMWVARSRTANLPATNGTVTDGFASVSVEGDEIKIDESGVVRRVTVTAAINPTSGSLRLDTDASMCIGFVLTADGVAASTVVHHTSEGCEIEVEPGGGSHFLIGHDSAVRTG